MPPRSSPGPEAFLPLHKDTFQILVALADGDRARLEAALAPLKREPGRMWREIEPGLEDVFIHLTGHRFEET